MPEKPSEVHRTEAAMAMAEWVRRNTPRVRRAMPWVQLATGASMVGIAWPTGQVQFDLIRAGTRTPGRIVGFESVAYARGSRPSSSAFHPVVEFEAGGRSVRFRDRIGSASSAGIHDEVTVVFRTDRPTVAMIDRPLLNWMPWGPTFVVGAFLVLVGVAGTSRARRKR